MSIDPDHLAIAHAFVTRHGDDAPKRLRYIVEAYQNAGSEDVEFWAAIADLVEAIARAQPPK